MTKNKEVINYLIFGALTTLINLIVYYILTNTILDPNITIELQIAKGQREGIENGAP